MTLHEEDNFSSLLALSGAKIYQSPNSVPIENGLVLVKDGIISKLGQVGDFSIAPDIPTIDCKGLFIVPGFQNNHVHLDGAFSEESSSEIAEKIRTRFSRYGFTTVVDLGSFLLETNALRWRIETGEILGPRILTAGSPIYPEDGIPYYLSLPKELLGFLPQPRTAEQAVGAVRLNIANGADLIKIFTGSLVERKSVKLMSEKVARAAVEEAHRHGKLVFTHPSSLEGMKLAAESGVDVLAHTASESEELEEGLLLDLISRKTVLVPTLKLWLFEAARAGRSREQAMIWADQCVGQLRGFASAGGRVLFGTDAGYMTDFDPREEYELMSRSGMPVMDILASLTAAPAELFGESRTKGRIAQGMDADIVVLEEDPAHDARNFSKVRYTIRRGRITYSEKKSKE